VPEPATLGVAAAATGLVGLGLYRRRRQGPRA
jgi:MYXO-CTERM domain-containing protein